MTHLLLDANFLSHRAFHALPGLSYNDVPTGVVFGFLRDVVNLMDQFDTESVAFCFDFPGRTLREDLLPSYKSTRRDRHLAATPSEQKAQKSLRKQIKKLETDYLPAIGFRNVFSQEGYEADDIIASLCQTIDGDDNIVVVSSDKDLFQLLSGRVSIWNPARKKRVTLQSFFKEWGVYPDQWPMVKALAGCSTDDVPGIDGIGEKTAAKFVAGALNPQTKTYEKILMGYKTCKKNLKLVRLPMKGTGKFKLRKDKVTQEKWETVAEELGLHSMKNDPPIPTRLRRKRRHG
jgi:DNA polymerase I